MAVNYTWEEFEQAAAPYLSQFSDADLKLARQNPNAGMSLLQLKQDYAVAPTDAAKALINYNANQIRSSEGGYVGGKTGASFVMTGTTPKDYSSPASPTYQNAYKERMDELLQQQSSFPEYQYSGEKPTYTSRYDDRIQARLNAIENPTPYSYDPATDPIYQNYRKQYTREGERAAANALAQSAAMTGGIPSSYAQTAASQAANYYAAQMTDKIPELDQIAYTRWLNDRNLDFSRLSALQGLEDMDYNRYLTDLGQYNTDRNFDYGVYLDRRNQLANLLAQTQSVEQNEYAKYLDQLNQYNADRQFGYGQLLDEINYQQGARQEQLQNALTAAEYGDYTGLNKMGIDTSNNPTDWERQYNLAVLAAKYGDYSGLQRLGINTNGIAAGGSGGGGETPDRKKTSDPTPDSEEEKSADPQDNRMGGSYYNYLLKQVNSGIYSPSNIAGKIKAARTKDDGTGITVSEGAALSYAEAADLLKRLGY